MKLVFKVIGFLHPLNRPDKRCITGNGSVFEIQQARISSCEIAEIAYKYGCCVAYSPETIICNKNLLNKGCDYLFVPEYAYPTMMTMFKEVGEMNTKRMDLNSKNMKDELESKRNRQLLIEKYIDVTKPIEV
jgi:hypothetical protein